MWEAWSISGPCLWPWLHGGDAGSSQVRRLVLIRQSKGLKRTLSVTEVAASESSYHLGNWMVGNEARIITAWKPRGAGTALLMLWSLQGTDQAGSILVLMHIR